MKCSKILIFTGIIGISFSEPGCPDGEFLCGYSCYNSKTHTCREGYHVCPFGWRFCKRGLYDNNGTCYDPSEYHCSHGDVLSGPKEKPVCEYGSGICDYECYNPAYYSCSNKHLCSAGFKYCPGTSESSCYNPKYSRCDDGNLNFQYFANLSKNYSLCHFINYPLKLPHIFTYIQILQI
ncbi:hypothetical protein H8356DRAFT_1679952 [Neocallimastix lanati (nom. inval.)]|nr:hypothetical protein H8356DRAFT_1679952 [Neocallimastix sp. JGI-2020a]